MADELELLELPEVKDDGDLIEAALKPGKSNNETLTDAEFFNKINEVGEQVTSGDKNQDSGKPGEDVLKQLEERLNTVEKRYGDSSKEAIGLRTEMDKLEPFVPILEEMQKNPEFLNYVRNYEKEGSDDINIVNALNLDKDFVMDVDEAVKNPKSDSAKVLRALITMNTTPQVNRLTRNQLDKDKLERDKTDFVKKHKMSDKEFKAFEDYSNKKTLTHDDVYFLMTREDRDKRIQSQTVKDVLAKLKENALLPVSLGSVASAIDTSKLNPDQEAFLQVLNAGGGEADNLFNK